MQLKALATLVLAGAALTSSGAAGADATLVESVTTLNVKLALLEKLGSDGLRVEVTLDGGALSLAGTVQKRETRELAETVASSVEGVDSVTNDILFETSEANPSAVGVFTGEAEAEVRDAVLSTRIRLALVDRMGSDGFRISTEVANGVVTLAFSADITTARRDEATLVVESVEGVLEVVTLDAA